MWDFFHKFSIYGLFSREKLLKLGEFFKKSSQCYPTIKITKKNQIFNITIYAYLKDFRRMIEKSDSSDSSSIYRNAPSLYLAPSPGQGEGGGGGGGGGGKSAGAVEASGQKQKKRQRKR